MIAILSVAQFLLVLDTTAINVSISEIVKDLDTSVEAVQFGITAYMLVMASMMLLGGKLGDRWGRRQTLRIGLLVFAVGSTITSVSQNAFHLLVGWALIDGIGAALLVPAMVALVADNHDGNRRVIAYGILGAVAASASAAGPLVGALALHISSWRLIFASEAVVALAAVLASPLIPPTRPEFRSPSVDWIGGMLSVVGLLLVVLGIQRSTAWGLLSPAPLLIAAGLATLAAFVVWTHRREAAGKEPLVRLGLLRIPQLRSGLVMSFSQQAVAIGTFLAIPLYLQIVRDEDALETALKLLPLSVSMLVAALAAPPLIGDRRPRTVVRLGLVMLLAGALLFAFALDRRLESVELVVSLVLIGTGSGLIGSQLGAVVMSAVDVHETGQAGGLHGAFQNLGGAVGTAIVGAVLIGGLTDAFDHAVSVDAKISKRTERQIAADNQRGVEFVPTTIFTEHLEEVGAPLTEVAAVAHHYNDSQLTALRVALLAVAVLAAIALAFTRSLPARGPPVRQRRAAARALGL